MINECSSPALGAILQTAKRIIGLIGIIAPILLIVMASIHLIRLLKDPDDKKAMPKLRNSAIAAMVLFFIPTIVNAFMYILDDSFTVSACWNSANKVSYTSQYVEVTDGKKKTFYSDPGDYEKGEKKPTYSPGTGSTGYNPGETIDGTAQQYGDVVWDPNDVTKISNLTSAQLIAILNAHGGKAKNFIPYASTLITTEQKYHVNVFFLIGIEALESGWVTSAISRNCNNLGGVRESKAHPSNGCGRNAGGGFAYFNSPNEFIDYHGSMLHTNYLTPGGKYYNGPTPSGVVVKYCPGCTSWPGSVTSIANSLFKHVKEVM
ncbi:MAG: glucosaminidase domain-containing protein [Bacilli bacterium]|nr:glucosaminidase domain-containing protein [Bacilli bacterium]